MRITNSMLVSNYLSNLNQNLNSLMEQQEQISTGKSINSLSDDPIGAITVMDANEKLERLEQYEDNISSATAWLSLTESSVDELNEVVQTAYENVVSIANDYYSAEEKEATAALIEQLRDQVLTIANTQSGSKYLFGGYNAGDDPFQVDETTGTLYYNGYDVADDTNAGLIAEGDQVYSYEVGTNLQIEVSITGTELLGIGDDNIYNILDDLYDALMSDADADTISSYATELQDAQSRVLSIETKIGGITNRLELLQERHEEDYLNYTTIKSNTEDVDQAEAITQYSLTESIYTASLSVSAQILQLTLVDYLD